MAKRHPDLLFDPDTDTDPDINRFPLSFSFRQRPACADAAFLPATPNGPALAAVSTKPLFALNHLS
ncbi:MAG: hypothetical protein ACOYOU_12745, partial [Kiritimatiellia bacterium]